MADLFLSLLGPFQAELHQDLFTRFGSRSSQAILIYLSCQEGPPPRREVLMDLLWPGVPAKSAQGSLRQAVYLLRKAIPEVKSKDGPDSVPLLLADRQTVHLNPAADIGVDVLEFEAAAGRDPERAAALYRGDFLQDFYLPDSETFEAWAADRRAYYRRRVLETLDTLAAEMLKMGAFADAERQARRQLEIDNLRESAHRQVMQTLANAGKRGEALAHYESLRVLLDEELGLEPDGQTTVLAGAIRDGVLDKEPVPLTRYPSEPLTPAEELQTVRHRVRQPVLEHNLPQRLTSFIGREEDIAALMSQLSDQRLVTLSGVGGIGKTNLSLQVARSMMEDFPGGVWFIELAPVVDPALILQTTTNALGLLESAEQPLLEVLLNFLAQQPCLLILDNCEHLIGDVAHFAATLLQHSPTVKIVASSREPLGIPGEQVYLVPPLSFPDEHHLPEPDRWEQFEAIRLFVERATAVRPEYRVTAENLGPLAQICRRLDGIPLALELAAARIKILTTTQISERLDDRFNLLTGGSRIALPRQQTLRALIDWSWELLADAEQRLLSRLAVFAGGMDLAAVEAVCADHDLPSYQLLDSLSELVNKSLVVARREEGQETRYFLLETIRQYALERLSEQGELENYRDRHLAYYLQLSLQAEPELIRQQQAVWLLRLETEIDNLRAALRHALQVDAAAGLQMATALSRFWLHGFTREGEALLGQLLEKAGDVDRRLRAKVLWARGWLAMHLSQFERANVLNEESLAIYKELGDKQGIARGLHIKGGLAIDRVGDTSVLLEAVSLLSEVGDDLGLAFTYVYLGRYEATFNNYDEALAYHYKGEQLFRKLGHIAGIADTVATIGLVAVWQGDYETARTKLVESLELQETLGQRGSSISLQLLGQLHFRQGEYELARNLLERSLQIAIRAGKVNVADWSRAFLGHVYLNLAEFGRAWETFEEAKIHFFNAETLIGVVFVLEGVARLAVIKNHPQTAARLIGWADATRDAIENFRPPAEQQDVDRDKAEILELLGEEAFVRAYAAGKEMTVEEAMSLARPQ